MKSLAAETSASQLQDSDQALADVTVVLPLSQASMSLLQAAAPGGVAQPPAGATANGVIPPAAAGQDSAAVLDLVSQLVPDAEEESEGVQDGVQPGGQASAQLEAVVQASSSTHGLSEA